MKRVRLLNDDEAVVPIAVITELLAAGQDLRASAVAGGAHLLQPARERWLKAELALTQALMIR